MIRVIQIIDSLQVGGAERVAVNYANGLTNYIEESHICVTREKGPLLKSINSDVGYLFLNKKSKIDIKAIFKLKKYIAKNRIDIIHAHSSSFFIAILVRFLIPRVKIVWHDHYGNSEFLNKRRKIILRFSSRMFSYIFSVNSQLRDWSERNLICKKVLYVKNFPVLNKLVSISNTKLHGDSEKRILCLANLREQKNHLRLLEAFQIVKNNYPSWTLHCVGKDFKDDYSKLFLSKLKELNLEKHVYFYDSKLDILNILKQSCIGVLVSKSEGLPLALLEYGLAELPVIATDVGDCGKLIPSSLHGILLSTDKKEAIADSIIKFIEDEHYREECSLNFNKKINQEYSSKSILNNIVNIYEDVLINK